VNRTSCLVLAAAVLATACKSAPTPPPITERPTPDVPPETIEGPTEAAPQEVTTVTQTATPQELSFPDEAFRAEQPAPAAPRPFRLPEIKPFTLANGIKVYLVEQHTLPIVSIDLSFDGGSVNDPRGKEGLASVCMAMMSEGTEQLDKIGFAEALADVAA